MIRFFLTAAAALALVGCTGTARAPSVPVFGSFFPAWIICAVGGVVLALVVRALLIRLRLDEHLPAPPLVYLCLAISGGIVAWLLWSGVIG
ncbi:YtcA family lipoprotein [Devosia sp. A449]